jgi:hypothetical protein
MAEESDLKSLSCGFESHFRHHPPSSNRKTKALKKADIVGIEAYWMTLVTG